MKNCEFKNAIHVSNVVKKYNSFELNINELCIPEGLATALIGENGAGKSTFLNIISGTRLDYKGTVNFFEDEEAFKGIGQDKKNRGNIDPFLKTTEKLRERIGFTSPNDFFLPEWTVKQVKDASKLLFSNFDEEKYDRIVSDLDIPVDKIGKKWKKVSELSDGNKMKLELATVLARDTDILILDEPASPLDPLMRDTLCDMIQSYIESKPGKRSVFFSTHNIADMEKITDYAIIMHKGGVIEQGFTEDLKEKYIMVKGDEKVISELKPLMIGSHESSMGIEGLVLSENRDKCEAMGAVCEVPTLTEISVSLMKQRSKVRI
ncbi:MAG: ABC transporter ATP-binding protein [Lachnospiraceae bacterium]|nr:ABC transporter ATP-binding protein [Lachnospiraceae bacterium]